MYKAVTREIEVSVVPIFLPEESEPAKGKYVWAYTIEIVNKGTITVQLKSRYWHITDGQGRVQEVRGPGVIGKEPVLRPGQQFRYTSGCPLTTPDGIMVGAYEMQSETGESFNIDIPAFPLHSPHVKRTLN
jgi:ApaG protein